MMRYLKILKQTLRFYFMGMVMGRAFHYARVLNSKKLYEHMRRLS